MFAVLYYVAPDWRLPGLRWLSQSMDEHDGLWRHVGRPVSGWDGVMERFRKPWVGLRMRLLPPLA